MNNFTGRIVEFPNVSVDSFNDVSNRWYFLSHCHSDHMSGLGSERFLKHLRNNSSIKFYCSEVSFSLLIADGRFYRLQPFISPLPINEPTVISSPDYQDTSGFVVTLLPAGHCPGSVMFLFERDDVCVLYTGDFRLTLSDWQLFDALKDGNCVKRLACLYLDTTFCVPHKQHLATREESRDAVFRLIDDWLQDGLPNRHVYLLTSAQYGSEFIFVEIYKRFGYKVHVTEARARKYQSVPEIAQSVTIDSTVTRIHACRKKDSGDPTKHLPCRAMENQRKDVMAIKLSTMWFAMYPSAEDVYQVQGTNFYRVCYSMHSSCSEILDAVRYLQPLKIHPLVIPVESSKSDLMETLRSTLDHSSPESISFLDANETPTSENDFTASQDSLKSDTTCSDDDSELDLFSGDERAVHERRRSPVLFESPSKDSSRSPIPEFVSPAGSSRSQPVTPSPKWSFMLSPEKNLFSQNAVVTSARVAGSLAVGLDDKAKIRLLGGGFTVPVSGLGSVKLGTAGDGAKVKEVVEQELEAVQRGKVQDVQIKQQELEEHRVKEQELEVQRIKDQELEVQQVTEQDLEVERVKKREKEQDLEVQRVKEQELEVHRVKEQELEVQRVKNQELEVHQVTEQDLEVERVKEREKEQDLEVQRVKEQELEAQRVKEQEFEVPRVKAHDVEETNQIEVQAVQQVESEKQIENATNPKEILTNCNIEPPAIVTADGEQKVDLQAKQRNSPIVSFFKRGSCQEAIEYTTRCSLEEVNRLPDTATKNITQLVNSPGEVVIEGNQEIRSESSQFDEVRNDLVFCSSEELILSPSAVSSQNSSESATLDSTRRSVASEVVSKSSTDSSVVVEGVARREPKVLGFIEIDDSSAPLFSSQETSENEGGISQELDFNRGEISEAGKESREVSQDPGGIELSQVCEESCRVSQVLEEDQLSQVCEKSPSVNQVLGESARVNQVHGESAGVNQVYGESAGVNQVLGESARVNQVLGESARVNQVLGESARVNQVLRESARVNQVLGESARVNQVLGESATVNYDHRDNKLSQVHEATLTVNQGRTESDQTGEDQTIRGIGQVQEECLEIHQVHERNSAVSQVLVKSHGLSLFQERSRPQKERLSESEKNRKRCKNSQVLEENSELIQVDETGEPLETGRRSRTTRICLQTLSDSDSNSSEDLSAEFKSKETLNSSSNTPDEINNSAEISGVKRKSNKSEEPDIEVLNVAGKCDKTDTPSCSSWKRTLPSSESSSREFKRLSARKQLLVTNSEPDVIVLDSDDSGDGSGFIDGAHETRDSDDDVVVVKEITENMRHRKGKKLRTNGNDGVWLARTEPRATFPLFRQWNLPKEF